MGHASSSHCEFTEVVANHLWFDVNLNEMLTVVNSDAASDELRKDGHVSAMGSNGVAARTADSLHEMLVLRG